MSVWDPAMRKTFPRSVPHGNSGGSTSSESRPLYAACGARSRNGKSIPFDGGNLFLDSFSIRVMDPVKPFFGFSPISPSS